MSLEPAFSSGPSLVFRDLRQPPPAPAPGEVYLTPARPEHRDRRDLSLLVLEGGLDALRHGPLPVTTIVVGLDPTFDDMLAALLAGLLAAGSDPPEGFRRFAEYAGMAKKGLYPGSVPLPESLVALYQAVRWGHPRLADPGQADGFLRKWARLAALVLDAARAGQDPFTRPLVPPWELAEEQAFLAGDRDLYLRDKQEGRRWLVRIPDEGRSAPWRAALLLRKPRSRLWKFWSRADPAAPPAARWWVAAGWGRSGGAPVTGYHLLGVDEEGDGNWVFSTNPLIGVHIASLRDLLQAEERRAAPDPARAEADPWVALYGGTLVAAPRAGSAVPEGRLINRVGRWARASSARTPRLVTTGLALVLLAGAVLGARWPHGQPPAEAGPVEDYSFLVESGGETLTRGVSRSPAGRRAVDSTEELEVDLPGRRGTTFTFRPNLLASRPVNFRLTLTLPEGGPPPSDRPVMLRVNGEEGVRLGFSSPRGRVLNSEVRQGFLRAGPNSVQVTLHNDGPEPVTARVRLSWEPTRPDLYLLAVGVGDYQDRRLHLEWPPSDARELARTFRAFTGKEGPFGRVISPPSAPDGTLLNPGRTKLLTCLKEMAKLTHGAPPGSLAVVTLAGHGKVNEADGHFLFLTRDYAPGTEGAWVSWHDLSMYIAGMDCPVIVILDACYSGRVKAGDLRAAMREDLKGLGPSRSGHAEVVLTASWDAAQEKDQWRHGALSLAVLEGLQGRHLFAGSRHKLPQPLERSEPFITLEDVRRYVEDRVEELTRDRQATDVKCSHGISLRTIRIAPARRPAPGG